MDRLKTIISLESDISYNKNQWLDCLSAIYYLKRAMRLNNSAEEMMFELKNRDPRFNDDNANLVATKVIASYF